MIDIAQILVIDRAKRAIAARVELHLERATAEEWLERAPDVVTDTVVSWSGVSHDQLVSLFERCGDPQGAELLAEAVQARGVDNSLLVVFWHAEAPVRGE